MSMLRFLAGIVLACSTLHAAAQSIALEGAPYVLEGTEVRTIRAKNLQRDYQVFVSLPASYEKSGRSYPVVFVTDANYAFPVTRAIAARAGNHGKEIEEFILVGLSYARGDTPTYSRRRDYTPAPTADRSVTSDMPGREPKFGEAEGYRRFITEEVFPFVAQRYRADMARKTLMAHSYGSLLGLDFLFNEPTAFENYVLGSPSLWFANKVMFERERAYAAKNRDLKANVYFAVGGFETLRPGPRYNKDDDMVRDMRDFMRALRSRHYPNLRMEGEVIRDEDHLTVAPIIITHGLRWALPGRNLKPQP
jgi:predicted alpha/beta superfamily hydrolase